STTILKIPIRFRIASTIDNELDRTGVAVVRHAIAPVECPRPIGMSRASYCSCLVASAGSSCQICAGRGPPCTLASKSCRITWDVDLACHGKDVGCSMSDRSAIEWTDATWNPVRGCTKVSPGCKFCYAEVFAERFRGVPGHPFEHGFELRLVPEKLEQPLHWKRPRKIFVNSMSDLFHEDVPAQFIARVGDVMRRADWHVFQVLTKRDGRMRELLSGELRWMADLQNVAYGVSVEDRRYGLPRIQSLQDTPAAIRFLSVEPLLVSRLRSSYAKSLDLVDDGVGRGGPDKRLALLVVIRQIRIDRRLQRRDTVERAAPNPLRGDRREEALDLVEPTRTGWRELDVIPRMPDKPARHLWRFMRVGVVNDPH